ncbi:MAG: hypothetical protein SWH61_15970 [Thermodesulfobacteriota bacterium]|nr:hypothetical protein [Thermodesulfobacteriota bacterium]
MLQKIVKALAYAGIVTLLYIIAANLVYYYFNGVTMMENWHYYDWVEYAYSAGLLMIAVSVLEMARALLRRD